MPTSATKYRTLTGSHSGNRKFRTVFREIVQNAISGKCIYPKKKILHFANFKRCHAKLFKPSLLTIKRLKIFRVAKQNKRKLGSSARGKKLQNCLSLCSQNYTLFRFIKRFIPKKYVDKIVSKS